MVPAQGVEAWGMLEVDVIADSEHHADQGLVLGPVN